MSVARPQPNFQVSPPSERHGPRKHEATAARKLIPPLVGVETVHLRAFADRIASRFVLSRTEATAA